MRYYFLIQSFLFTLLLLLLLTVVAIFIGKLSFSRCRWYLLRNGYVKLYIDCVKVIPQFCIAHFYCAHLITYNFIHYTYQHRGKTSAHASTLPVIVLRT